MKVYLIRHGQTEANRRGIYYDEDYDLNLVGRLQARRARRKLTGKAFDVVISSPLLRAKRTAEIVNGGRAEIVFDERLRERDMRKLAGRKMMTTNRVQIWDYYSGRYDDECESVAELFQRVAEFIEELKGRDYDAVVVVAHSGICKGFSAYFEGIGDGKFLLRGARNCEVREFEL
ncbi:histidine phosphatase family protein [Candidatus Saccharibacteria bacterium]|nr:histidine phosphatase family protein [Candidatus Saccharibacteria bacterium]